MKKCSVIILVLMFGVALQPAQAEKQPTLEELLKIWEKSQPTASSSEVSNDKPFKNTIGMEFVLIPAGEFTIGEDCPADDPFTKSKNEFAECKQIFGSAYPPKKVTIAQPFYMSKYEVTQEQWSKVMATKEHGNNPSHFQNEVVGSNSRQHPVDNVSWVDVQTFIQKLNTLESTDKYRLPTEAEWEYAARGGTNTVYFFGNSDIQLGEYAWFAGNSNQEMRPVGQKETSLFGGLYNTLFSSKKTHPVGQKKANPFGLHDILGNVLEWTCSDYEESYSSGKESICSKNANGNKSIRGGSWVLNSNFCRVANRGFTSSDSRDDNFGFRLVLSVSH